MNKIMQLKHIAFSVLLGILSISVFGCSARKDEFSNKIISTEKITESTKNADSDFNYIAGSDLTVKCNCIDYTHEQLNNTVLVSAECSFAYSVPTLDSLYSHAESIINCTVCDVRYTVLEGTPYTIYDVIVNEVYHGVLNVGDKISILQYGGYMTVQDEIDYYKNDVRFNGMTDEEKQNILIEKRSTTGANLMEGDSFVTFIAKEDILEGAYYTINEGESIFLFHDADTLIRYTSNYENNKISLSDIISMNKG